MILLIAGALFLALGLFAGGLLVAAPLGLFALDPGVLLWVLFPAFTVTGYAMFVIGARHAAIRVGSLVVSGLLLLLALASAAGLVLKGAALITPEAGSFSLWYVLVVAGLVGAVGAASLGGTVREA